MKRYKLLFAMFCFGVVMYGLRQSTGVEQFMQYAKRHSIDAAVSDPYHLDLSFMASAQKTRDQLGDDRKSQVTEWITAEAEKRRIAPINAKIDSVWKAIPGYNGLEVDIEKTLQLAERQSYPDQPQLVFREISPQVGLDQLGPQPIYKGNPKKPMVALMINVAWGDEFLPSMLETFSKENVHATFFFDGTWLKKNIPTARKIMEQGHEVSNHAYSHKNMSKLNRAQSMAEIKKTEELLTKELGVQNKLFAPPSGDFNQATVELAHELNLRTILWTLDTVDWKKPEPASIVRKISAGVEPGSLILMHPTSSSSGALKEMIYVIKNKGLALGTVSEVISSKRYPEVESTGQ